jgi:DNA-binding transcriptional LysR family regulator
MTEPLETAELLAFARTAELLSLSRAAAELGVPRATLSRRLSRLEERLAVRLLRRTTRSMALTDAGELLYRHAQEVLEAVEQAEQAVRRRDDQAIGGELRVSVPPMRSPEFNAFLTRFAATYPGVRLSVHFSSSHVDLVRGGYDVAMRASATLEPGLVARTLRRDALLVVAAPAYLAAHGTPRTRRDLRAHRVLQGFARGERPSTYWPLVGGGQVRVEGVLATNELGLLCDAAEQGLGLALIPRFLAHDRLEQGALVHVLAGVVGTETKVSVVYREREFVAPQVRAFVDALVAWAPEGLLRRDPPVRVSPRAAVARRAPAPRARRAR